MVRIVSVVTSTTPMGVCQTGIATNLVQATIPNSVEASWHSACIQVFHLPHCCQKLCPTIYNLIYIYINYLSLHKPLTFALHDIIK